MSSLSWDTDGWRTAPIIVSPGHDAPGRTPDTVWRASGVVSRIERRGESADEGRERRGSVSRHVDGLTDARDEARDGRQRDGAPAVIYGVP